MAHRALFVCLTLLCSAQLLLAQQEDESWLSLSRLSLTASGSYHYAPWKKYNESLHLVQDAIRYNPAYPNRQGSLDLINGDLTYQLEARYRVFQSFSILFSAGWMQTEGVIEYHSDPSSPYGSSYTQTMWLHSYHYGAGIEYTYTVNDFLSCSTVVSVARYPAHLDFQAASSLPTYSNLFEANLKESALGAHAQIDAQLRVSEHFKIIPRVEYRWLTFKNFSGKGSETDINQYSYATSVDGPRAFDAQLGEAGGYFGLYILPANVQVNSYLLHLLWSRTPAEDWWNTQRPTSLDLLGFGFGLGVCYEF